MKTESFLPLKKGSLALFIILAFLLSSLFFILPGALMDERTAYEEFIKNELQRMGVPEKPSLSHEMAADKPDEAAIQNYLMTLDPELGMVPSHRIRYAYEELMAMEKNPDLKSYGEDLSWEGTPAAMGGRMRALMYDPNDPAGNKVWSGSVTGGLWYTEDITSILAAWVPVNDFWDNISISCITYDPNNTSTFYVGTGEAQTAMITYRESSGLGMGILRSTDGGETWSVMESTQDFAYITDIAVYDDNGTSVIFAGVVSGRYMGSQHQSIPSDGLYRSTDGGETWNQVLPNIPGTGIPYSPSDIEITSAGKIFVGTMQNVDMEGGGVILYSDHGLTGTWTVYDEIRDEILDEPDYNVPGRVILASCQSDPNYVYGLIGSGETTYFTAYHCYHIVRTTDAGNNWVLVNIPPRVSNRNWAYISWHALAAGVDPNNPQTLIVGGLDLWKSDNAGGSWNVISDWQLMYSGGGGSYVHGDLHSIIYKEGSSDEIIFSTDGGVFYTSTGSYGSPEFYEKNQGLATLQYYTCDIHPVPGSNSIVGGLQDNGSLYYEDGSVQLNDMVSGGDGAYCFFDEDQPEIFITSVYYNWYYFHVDQGGGVYSNSYNDFYNTGYFINPADYDSYNNTLYANGGYWSNYNQNTLLRITGIPNSPDGELFEINTNSDLAYSHIKFSPYSASNSATLFIGTWSGLLYKVTDANTDPVVEEIGADDFPVATISCVALGGSEDTVLVTFSNYGVSSIWQSYDGGNTWEEKEGNLPDMPVRWALYHPHNASNAIIATETGVWATNSLHTADVSWEPQNEGMANVRVDMLQMREADHTVLAATHGRGTFTCEYAYSPPVSVPEINNEAFTIYPNPVRDFVRIDLDDRINDKFTITIIDNSGRVIKDELMENDHRGMINMDLSFLPAGTYHMIIKDDDFSAASKVVKL
jgi:hypothetical protein